MDTPNPPVIAAVPVPNEVRRWNWGAFFLTWIWGIGNNVLVSFLVWLPFLGFIWPIVLGIKGGEWAWQKKRWESVAHFQRVQRIWAWVGFGVFLWVMSIMVGMIYFIVTHIPETKMYFENIQVIRTATAQDSFTGNVSGSDRFIQSQTTLPSAAIDIPGTPGVGSVPPPSIGTTPSPSLMPQTLKSPLTTPLSKVWDAWHNPLLDDNPNNAGATPWIRSFLPKRATKNIE